MTRCIDPRVNELLGAYLLGACPQDEADAVRAHIAQCTACTRESAELVVARDALLLVAPSAAAPPALKGRVMAQVRADAELFAAAGGPRADAAPAPLTAPPRREPARERQRRFGWLRSPVPLAAAASFALAIAVGGTLLGSSLGSNDASPAAAQVHLGSVDGAQAPGGRARVVLDESGTARLEVSGLPSPGRERVYQVWLRSGEDAPVATHALFSVLEDGRGETIVPGNLKGIDEVLVTSEPAGGSTAPTRAALVAVKV